jgi:hypothetical protein
LTFDFESVLFSTVLNSVKIKSAVTFGGIARMEYDLIRLFEHPICLDDCIPAAVVTFGTTSPNEAAVQVRWRRNPGQEENEAKLTLRWDLKALKVSIPRIEHQIQSLRERDEDQGRRTELAAVAVAAAVMAHIEPET